MKTLPEILDDHNTKVKQASKRYDGYPVSKGKRELKQAIAKELMGCLPEKNRSVGSDIKDLRLKGYNQALDEVRARLTAFIGEEVR